MEDYNKYGCWHCKFLSIDETKEDACYCPKHDKIVAWNDDACKLFELSDFEKVVNERMICEWCEKEITEQHFSKIEHLLFHKQCYKQFIDFNNYLVYGTKIESGE